MERKMFCYQCQETAGCTGCTLSGVCGKKPDVAAMQDLLVYVTKGLSAVTTALREQGAGIPADVNHLITLNLFTTITNANFDKEAIESRIRMTLSETQRLLPQVENQAALPAAALWDGSENWEAKAAQVGVLATENEDIRSLRALLTSGLKGRASGQCCRGRFPAAGPGRHAGRFPHCGGSDRPDHGDRQIRRGGHGAAGPGQHHRLRQPGDHQGLHWRG